MSRLRPSPALIVAIVALVVALGGTGYAAIKLPANSVGAKQLKKNAVVRAKIKNGAIDATKLAANSVGGASINESTLGKVPLAAVADNSTHATAAAGLDKITYKSADGSTPIAPSGSFALGTLAVNCDPGQHPVGGGLALSDFTSQLIVDAQVGPSGYVFRVVNLDSTAAHTFTGTTICVTAAAVG